jgi:hypothetical protein
MPGWPANDRSTRTLVRSTPPPPAARQNAVFSVKGQFDFPLGGQLACPLHSALPRTRRRLLVVRALGQLLQEAYAFPIMSNAVPVFVSSASSFALRAQSRSNSTTSADFVGCFTDRADRRESVTPGRAPALGPTRSHAGNTDLSAQNRALLTSFGAFSYSATIAQLVLRAERPARRTRRRTPSRARTRRHLTAAGRRSATLLR